MLGIGTVFVKHPTKDEGFLIDHLDAKNVNSEMWNKYGEKVYEQEMKEQIYNRMKEFMFKSMTFTEWCQLPKPKPFIAEY